MRRQVVTPISSTSKAIYSVQLFITTSKDHWLDSWLPGRASARFPAALLAYLSINPFFITRCPGKVMETIRGRRATK